MCHRNPSGQLHPCMPTRFRPNLAGKAVIRSQPVQASPPVRGSNARVAIEAEKMRTCVAFLLLIVG